MSKDLEVISEHRCFDGVQRVYRHDSESTSTPMQFAVFTPAQKGDEKFPVLWFLSGLTCTEENFTVKSGAQKFAAQHGMILVAPDTSPRGADIDGEDDDYDFGSGAGFYVDATQPPWNRHYKMYSYITSELQQIVIRNFPVDKYRQGITGHSMGGHGALTIGLRNPKLYRSISAFSPICSPKECPWGQKALSGYLGSNYTEWDQYDAVELIKKGFRSNEILVDQGRNDDFLDEQLKPALLSSVCTDFEQPLNLRLHKGYDHSYFFIASFIEDHIQFHAALLQ